MDRKKLKSKYGMSIEQPAASVTDSRMSLAMVSSRPSSQRRVPTRGMQFIIPGLFEADPDLVKLDAGDPGE